MTSEGKKAHMREQSDTSRANGGVKAKNPIAVIGDRDTQGGDASVREPINEDYSYADLQQDLAFIIETEELEQDLADIMDADAAEEEEHQSKANDQEQKKEKTKEEQKKEKLPESQSTTSQSRRSTEEQKKNIDQILKKWAAGMARNRS